MTVDEAETVLDLLHAASCEIWDVHGGHLDARLQQDDHQLELDLRYITDEPPF